MSAITQVHHKCPHCGWLNEWANNEGAIFPCEICRRLFRLYGNYIHDENRYDYRPYYSSRLKRMVDPAREPINESKIPNETHLLPRTQDTLVSAAPGTKPSRGSRNDDFGNQERPAGGWRGLLGGIASAATAANDLAHGKRLREGLLSTGAHIKSMTEDIRTRTLQNFKRKCDALAGELGNWSVGGRIEMGRQLQARARKEFDFNQVESYALWMAGAWLESGSRNSDDAVFVREALEELRHRI